MDKRKMRWLAAVLVFAIIVVAAYGFLAREGYDGGTGAGEKYENGGAGSVVEGSDPEDGNAPGDSGGNAPGDNGGNAPGDSGGNAPGDNGGNAPGGSSGNSPGGSSGNAPGGSSGNAPGDNDGNAPGGSHAEIDEDGSYTKKDDVALYIATYGRLPDNFITKNEARKLGWDGGSVEKYSKGKAIGGDVFGNYEKRLPKKNGRVYYECDIDTLGKSSRGAKRIVFSNDGLVYYTSDHYETFTLLYGEP